MTISNDPNDVPNINQALQHIAISKTHQDLIIITFFIIITLCMLYSKKGNTDKSSFNNLTVPSSPSLTDSSNKKKMFKRKPAYTFTNVSSDIKPNILQFSADDINVVKPVSNHLRSSIALGLSASNNQQRKTINPPKVQNSKKQPQFTKFREVFFSPKSQKTILSNGINFFQRKPVHTFGNNKSNDMQQTYLRNSFAFKRDVNASFENDQSQKGWKCKTNSVQSFGYLPKASQKSITINSEQTQLGDRNISSVQCPFCFNNSKKFDLISQKYSKLQEQHNTKLKLIKQLTTKYDNLAKENTYTQMKFQDTFQRLQAQESQFYRMKEELTQRIDSYKKDIHCLTQTIRYNQIEKSMLLRFKKDNQEITKQCELLKYENEQYKKQLIAMVNREHGYTYNHHKNITPQKNHPSHESPSRQFNKKNQNNNNIQNIYYDCEDDTVSLSFSQQSMEYV